MPERTVCEYKNFSKRFYNTSNDYTRQYCAIYNVRLEKMRTILENRIEKKYGKKYPVCKLPDLSRSNYPKCIIIGTLFKDQKLKPSVLKQLHSENQLVPQPVHQHFTDESDAVFIEDDSQRYRLIGNIEVSQVVTGITCAFLGTDHGDGKFEVEETVFADLRPQINRTLPADDVYVVFMSGLDLQNYEKHLVNLQLLSQWIVGCLGNFQGIDTSKISRVIIAGNSILANHSSEKPAVSMTTHVVQSDENLDAIKVLDTFLSQLCQVVEVDLMPGDSDPSNHVLPQKNLHICMFPQAGVFKSMNSVTNPYDCEFGGCRIAGTSGQPVTDVLRFSDIDSPLNALEACLRWNHLAPTAPDTLGCFPYYDQDPFILETCPNVFFTANHGKFETKVIEGDEGQVVRLIVVPEFASTKTICLLNLKDLSCVPICFSC